jgi:hypothetical protein
MHKEVNHDGQEEGYSYFENGHSRNPTHERNSINQFETNQLANELRDEQYHGEDVFRAAGGKLNLEEVQIEDDHLHNNARKYTLTQDAQLEFPVYLQRYRCRSLLLFFWLFNRYHWRFFCPSGFFVLRGMYLRLCHAYSA